VSQPTDLISHSLAHLFLSSLFLSRLRVTAAVVLFSWPSPATPAVAKIGFYSPLSALSSGPTRYVFPLILRLSRDTTETRVSAWRCSAVLRCLAVVSWRAWVRGCAVRAEAAWCGRAHSCLVCCRRLIVGVFLGFAAVVAVWALPHHATVVASGREVCFSFPPLSLLWNFDVLYSCLDWI
jgi:hypothetical protein